MKGTIKGKLTLAVILIVVATMLVSTGIIVGASGRNLNKELTNEMQVNAAKYANSINSWIEMEKGMNAAGAAAFAAVEKCADTVRFPALEHLFSERCKRLCHSLCAYQDICVFYCLLCFGSQSFFAVHSYADNIDLHIFSVSILISSSNEYPFSFGLVTVIVSIPHSLAASIFSG